MDKETDVISMDFPEYEEGYPPLPDVTAELPFAEGKEEVYRRNRLIAAEERVKQLAEEEKKKADRKAELENMYMEAAKANHSPGRLRKSSGADKKAAAVIKIAVAAMIAMVLSFSIGSIRPDNDGAVTEYAESEAVQVLETSAAVRTEVSAAVELTLEEKQSDAETEADTAEAVSEPAEVSEAASEEETEAVTEAVTEADEVTARQPAVPFEEEQGAVVYNTDALSFKFVVSSEPIYIDSEYFGGRYAVDVSVRNLTADEYMIIANNFYVPRDGKNDYILSQSGYDESTTYFTSWQRHDDSEEWTRSPIAFGFDDENSCGFTLEFTLSPGEELYVLGYDRDHGWGEAKAGDFEFMPEDFEAEIG